jgi:hypothetical protein
MNPLRVFLLSLLLSICARAESIYQIRQLSEKDLLQTYISVMRDACRHADKFWTNSPADPRARMWGSGRSDQMNEGVRAISGMVLTCGALLKYCDDLTEAERKEYFRKTIAAIHYAVSTHLTGTQKCTDGKPWGGSWQSAMWTATLAFGAWLIWEDLDADVRSDIERVVASEADRFLAGKPPGGSVNDTKAEENGWNMICISIAANMFPQHPHAAAWNKKAIEYMMNTLSAPQDRHDKSLVDGLPVSEWFAAENVHADFTLENHRFFHPAYVACSSYFLTETAMQYAYAQRPIPQAASHHLMDTWRMFQGMILPQGESAYPQGMDWELHGLPFINLFASLASWKKDAFAARMEKTSLQYIRAWQRMGDGDLAVPGSRLGFTRHACSIDQITYGFLAHKIFGVPAEEMTARKATSLMEGVRAYDSVEFITHRTGTKFVSFSWRNRIMGMLIPIGAGHEGNPEFTVPIANGFVGSFELTPRGDTKTTVVEHAWKKTSNGFETTGTLLLNGGRLKQTLKVISIGNNTVVYQDRVIALSDVDVTQERGLPLGIENDKITGGTRAVFHENGRMIFDWQQPQPPVAVSGSWANVEGRLGIVMVAGSGITYSQAAGYSPGIAVYADILYNSFSDQPKHFKAGEQVARRVAICFVETTPKKTATLARSYRIENKASGQVLRFKRPEGGNAEVFLAK